MKIENINFPKSLLDALRDNKLVVFAGAGVSMGEPACLPNFESLTNVIAKDTRKTPRTGEKFEEFLGRLQDEGVKVHLRAKQELSQEGLKATNLHRDLLRLYRKAEPVRLITTNFDLLFEQAAEGMFDNSPEVFRAPALPLGREFDGIVHVHGSVRRPNEMVLTDKDFGRAYLTDGWAQRFLVELFSNFRILFVGYSHDDTIMNYLARALPGGSEYQRFILTGSEDKKPNDDWRSLGIEPIVYPQANKNDYSKLDTGIHGLAELVQRSVVEWKNKISEIAQSSPPDDETRIDLIEYALGDETETRFFTKAAIDPKWIDWLDEHGHLTGLFRGGILTEQAKILSWWLADRFIYSHPNKLFLLISKHNTSLHPRFWDDVARKLGTDTETFQDKKVLSRWLSLLLSTAPTEGDTTDGEYVFTSNRLGSIGKRCIAYEMFEDLLLVFFAMIQSRLLVRGGYYLPGDANEENLQFRVELTLRGEHDELNELWEEGLEPNLSQVAKPLLERVVIRLEEQYFTLHTWGKVHGTWDPISDGRLAIEAQESGMERPVDVIIDAARDCLQWLVHNQPKTAMRWCSRRIASAMPLLRRLAVYGVSKFDHEHLKSDDKIYWLLKYNILHAYPVRNEVHETVRQAYPAANRQCRECIIEAVWAYQCANEEDLGSERRTAWQHFEWFDCIHKSDPNCDLAKTALDEVLAQWPEFGATEHQPRIRQGKPSAATQQSSYALAELPPTPSADRPHELLSNQTAAWDEAKHSQVFQWLVRIELYPKYSHEIADALYALVENGGPSYALNLLPRAKQIAAALWHHLDRTAPINARGDWLFAAMNHPAGRLAYFWISALSLWREHQDPKPSILSDEYHRALSDIVADRSSAGMLGRTVLASKFHILMDADEVWTLQNLLPLFDSCSDDFQMAWDGFVKCGKLNPTVAKAMTNLFLKAVTRIGIDLFNQRDLFVKYYIAMLIDGTYLADDPLSEWIPKLFENGSQENPSAGSEPTLFPRDNRSIAEILASEMSSRLRNMPETEQRELWQRWLKNYWQNRLDGVPVRLTSGEAKLMLDWLTDLNAVFPEAVDLAIQMPSTSLAGTRILSSLVKNSALLNHPEAVAKLLIYLWQCNIPGYYLGLAKKIVGPLVGSNIPPELKQKLEDIKIQL